jgi:hypothetical protein
MYFSTRRFPAGQNAPALFVNEIYQSTNLGIASVVPGFSVPTPGYSISDLAGCYFPNGVLAQNLLTLSANNVSGIMNLRWQVNNNDQTFYYELQRSEDEINFETISRVDVRNSDHTSEIYAVRDAPKASGKNIFYRVRQQMNSGMRYYSNVVKINTTAKIDLIERPTPNPFSQRFSFNAQLRADNQISVRLTDQGGRMVYQKLFSGHSGSNKITVENLPNVNPGIYLLEIKVENETIHEKLIKH